jgi:hypothetical protein
MGNACFMQAPLKSSGIRSQQLAGAAGSPSASQMETSPSPPLPCSEHGAPDAAAPRTISEGTSYAVDITQPVLEFPCALSAAASLMDTYNETLLGTSVTDEDVSNFVARVWRVVRDIPAIAEAVGGFAEQASLVGVVFAVLKAAGHKIIATGETMKALQNATSSVEALLSTLKEWETHRSSLGVPATAHLPFIAHAQQTLVSHCELLLKLSLKVSSKGYASRVFDQSKDQQTLESITASLSEANRHLHSVINMMGLYISEDMLASNRQIWHTCLHDLSLAVALTSFINGYAQALVASFRGVGGHWHCCKRHWGCIQGITA